MRFLNTTTFELEESSQANIHDNGYAIFSHRWLAEGEVEFEDLKKHIDELRSSTHSLPGVSKIHDACVAARARGFKWLWMDTCCIDKKKSDEYATAINSMFNWYRNAKLCITFMADVKWRGSNAVSLGKEAFRSEKENESSAWFRRGWTLQELMASSHMEFYDMDWKCMGTKKELATALSDVTGIDKRFLTGEQDLSEASIAMKMSWMFGRETGKPEDRAYSLLGLFNVKLHLAYGEGMATAFRRLQEVILASPLMEESLFAWKMPDERAGDQCEAVTARWEPEQWGLLAGSPDWFKDSGDVQVDFDNDAQVRSFRMTPKGIEGPFRIKQRKDPELKAWITVLALSVVCIPFGNCLLRSKFENNARKEYAFTLNCFRTDTQERRSYVEIYLLPIQISPVLTSEKRPDGGLVNAPYVEWNGIVYQPRLKY
ncbi:HET-domain-containing protein [Apiospora phragmitis]|uniref:HET-domain-containing protein n=1 Tax=Apiospora phragmitis TaxID=2905665 RepID=A0ABR1UIU3_9PEZI